MIQARPSERWKLLLDADWKLFFASSPKTHLEFRWWYCLLASSRRVFLLHVFTFCICVVVALHNIIFRTGTSTAIYSWDWWLYVPYLFIIAPLISALGAIFESWARPDHHTNASLVKNLLVVLVLLLLCVIISSAQAILTPAEFGHNFFADWLEFGKGALSAAGLTAMVLTLLIGSRQLVTALLPAAQPANSTRALESKLWFESKIAYLMHQPRSLWLTYFKMNIFWLGVFTAKLCFAIQLLFPTILEASESIAALNATLTPSGIDSEAFSPQLVLRVYLGILVWLTALVLYLADTLGWYQLMTALWGGFVGLWDHGIGRGRNVFLWDAGLGKRLRLGACATLLPALAESEEQVEVLREQWASHSKKIPSLATNSISG